MSIFASRLRALRWNKEMTLDELANSLNTTKATLSRYENNKVFPNIEFAEKIAAYFEVSVDYLLGTEDREKYRPIKEDELPVQLNEIDPDMAIKVVANNEGLNAEDIKDLLRIIRRLKGH